MFKVALEALTELLRWRRVAAEIAARRLVLTELEKVDDEIDEIEKSIERDRIAGRHVDADKRVLQLARRASLERGIFEIAERAGIARTERLHFGGFGSGEGERPSDNGLDQSTTA